MITQVHSAELAAHLRTAHPSFARALRREGVRYRRTLPFETDPSSPIGQGWRRTFNASSEAEVVLTSLPPGE